MAKELQIELAKKTPDGIHVFTVSGALGVEGSTGIQRLLDACLKEKVHKVVLDLEGVNFISSAGMGAFLSAVGELRKKRGDIIFARMRDKILTVFKTLDVLDYFIVADDVEGAVERFRGGKLPRPPSIEELTAGPAEAAEAAAPTASQPLFSLLAAYSDVFGGDAEISHKLSQLVDVTANYLSLEQCAFVPLTEGLGLATTAARGSVPVPATGVKKALADAMASREITAIENLPQLTKELAAWAAKSRARFLLPLGDAGAPTAVLVVGDKKDGTPVSNEERRLLRYLKTSLHLALECHVKAGRAAESAGDKKEIGRKIMEMETLFEISRGLAEALETEKMLPTLLMMATGQFGTDRAVILLGRVDGGFEVRAARGLEEKNLAQYALPREGLVEIIRHQAGPAALGILALTLDDSHRHHLKPFVDGKIAVLAPMRFKNELVGILGLGAKLSGRDYDAAEIQLLRALVNLAAVHTETARLLDGTKKNYGGLVRALISAIEAKDEFTRGHTERVTLYASALGDELGLTKDQRQDLLFGAVLHDVGYLGVPEEILRMPDGLTEEQLAELRRHPLIGVNILKDIPFLQKALGAVRHHHEWYDGSGYPDGLAGEDIPLLARVVAVADAFDAITTDRRYRAAKSKEEGLAEIEKNRRAQFDPAIVDALGALVRSGRLELLEPKRRPRKESDA
jgi:anti-anti-sigma factor